MKTIIAIAFALISTSASAWNIFDTLNVIQSISASARNASEAKAAEAVAAQASPAPTPTPVCPSGEFNSYGNCVGFLSVTPVVFAPVEAKAAQDAYLAQPSAPFTWVKVD